MKTDPKIDKYIAKSADFAKPVLNYIRSSVHKACPQAEEKIKWGFPHFDYKGEMMCSMAAFKAHCAFTFWKGSIMKDPEKVMNRLGESAMGQFGRITKVDDLPGEEILFSYIKEAMDLNDRGIKIPKPVRKEVVIPEILNKALGKNATAKKVFENFPPGHKREYIEWINEAKREETRISRVEKCIQMISEGKTKNYKYESKKR